MKALTITASAQRSTQSATKLRKLAKSLTSILFAERVALAVSSAGSVVSFLAAVTDHPRACAAIVAVTLPWFMSLLSGKGGEA